MATYTRTITEAPRFFLESVTAAISFLITNSFNVIDTTPAVEYGIAGLVIDSAAMTDSIANQFVVGAIVADDFDLTDGNSTKQILQSLLTETAAFVTTFVLDNETYTGVVINTENGARTEYTAYDFNSMCRFNGGHYGAKEDGIHLLDGADDAGADIDAHILTGISDFDIRTNKRIDKAYLGIRNDGNIVLKATITSADDGLRREYWYEISDTSTGIRKTRIKMGKGLKAKYWQFELSNKDGSDFELDVIKLIPITLTRKV